MEGLEIFIPDLPIGLTDHSLRKQLDPYITKTLGIKEWSCEKNRGKKFGNITFLYRIHGEQFLEAYGNQHSRRRGPQARLVLLGKEVQCRRSNRNPNPYLLRSLLKMAEDENLYEDDEHEQPLIKNKDVAFEIYSFSCGHYEYPDGTFSHATDIAWETRSTKSVARFARDSLVISLEAYVFPLRVEIPYRAIYEIIDSQRPTSFTMALFEAPRIYHFDPNDPGASKIRLPQLSSAHAEILGQSLVYRIQVSPASFNAKLEDLKKKEKLNFSHFDIPESVIGKTYMVDGMRTFRNLLNEYYVNSIIPFDVLFQFQALVQNGYLLPQTVEIVLRRIRQVSQTSPANASRKTPGQINGHSGVNITQSNAHLGCPFSAGAVKKLFKQTPFPGPDISASIFNPDNIWSLLESNEKEIRQGTAEELVSERVGRNLIMVYKVQITPTRITLLGPEPEAKNRILRKFPKHTGFFARVQFCEEDGQDVFFNARVSLVLIWARFKQILLKGVHIAGREYMFLGFSHSSLRAHGVWFMATFVDHNSVLQISTKVIKDLGKFSQIQSPSRCAARIGQAFSETPFAIDLHELGAQVQYIPDVKSRDGSRVFSDGVGTLSRSLMEAIQAALPKNRDTTTCFQIRWGGAKGMLSLDDTLPGMVMRIRKESMVKFESEDIRLLEICDMANKPIPLVLNRQMIKILEDMGVSGEWFLAAQNRELRRLREITAQIQNTVVFLKRQKIAEQINFSKFIRRLSRLEIDYRKDGFLCSAVETVVLREVRLLKHKARIPVEKGVTLFGILDEFNFLTEDEVYITFEHEKLAGNRNFNLHEKLVLVTRSPALHPGDIQVRRAVIPPPGHPLRSLSNCIAFSQQGMRDLPSQLSGGDLDGDIYNIIWDKEAVDSAIREFEPADYPLVKPKNIGREVTPEDMTDFFVDFMATDQLGVIATKHMILADMKPVGTFDKECLLLAELHSIGVDYSKSGIPIDVSKLRNLTRTDCRPEFLAPAPPAHIIGRTEVEFETQRPPSNDEDDDSGPRHKYYKSEKILGKLFRAIDEKKIWKQDIHHKINRYENSVWDQLIRHILSKCRALRGVDWQAALDDAYRIREAYDDAIWSATMDYSDNFTQGLTELEVFTGCIFSKSGIQTRRQRDKSIRLKDEYDRIAKWIEGLIRKKEVPLREGEDADADEFNDQPTDHDASGLGSSLGPSALDLSIACLHVSTKQSDNTGRSKIDLQSFRIVAAQCALTELDLALARQEAALAADMMAANSRFPHAVKVSES
ncbi:RdRP-domain-containing protein [Annulohypoxylon maeteangense]|uniref:RdRP-domain-containing protein n=1 Tax=Annulohypoxylon maeteangense TaxID=1927788 RepID=UPI002007D035|nr:RdRP-domain-containing protein [Annulohypoxylon maeteangense]KAI0885091.1 RdRP-domain-containing protein [Annulohypoxylon maeteangense]